MHSSTKPRAFIRVKILGSGEPNQLPITVVGRECWALRQLMSAGDAGCTPIDQPGPRWSHYVWKLRGYGLIIETEQEKHDGAYPGYHARYFLRSDIEVIEASDDANASVAA